MSKKIALVTGASRGIGKEIALALAKEGYDIAFSFNSNKEMAEIVKHEIEEIGSKAVAIKADVSSKEDVDNMIKLIGEELGTVDVLVNNAGITKDNLLIRMSEEDWDDVITVNLKSAFLTTKAVARSMMKKRYGKIINLSSVVGIMGNAGQANYSASKAGLIGLTKSTAKELAGRGIRVNAIAPGFVSTDMTNALSDEVKETMLKAIPLGYFASTKEISDLVVFLASEKSDYITGQVIEIDGGMNI
ncbi:MAG: 3-oxoacyl-[acyl-carrier-protein] reductase [Tissierellia bacterium]|nr:3-oxoacyl-[acyl-carrier-protein] reductase [Tissierellia bacterium]